MSAGHTRAKDGSRPRRDLRGAFAASVTPLRDGGAALDEEAFGSLADFLARGGLDGVLPLGTTGEGILLSFAERMRAAELFLEALDGRLAVVVHCGAQTTAATVGLAAHAAEAGADGVAVIGPPYFPLDERELFDHFAAAARACAPLPFFLYEFAARSGYRVPLPVIERLRQEVGNLAGLKVSDTPWERFEPYLLEGLDIFVGPEALIDRGIQRGAAGAVSALASTFPELVAQVVREPSADRARRLGELRAVLQRFPLQAAFKVVLERRGVAVGQHVRRPLRPLDDAERAELLGALESVAEGALSFPP